LPTTTKTLLVDRSVVEAKLNLSEQDLSFITDLFERLLSRRAQAHKGSVQYVSIAVVSLPLEAKHHSGFSGCKG
jgi:hypothetical protein